MTSWSAPALVRLLLFSVMGWLLLAGACVCVGSTGQIGLPSAAVFGLRYQVVLMASLVGAALAASGCVYQSILRNPLADPYLLGVSSGASLFAYLWRFPQITSWLLIPALMNTGISQQAFAWIGALLAVGFVLGIGGQRGRLDPVTLILVGVIVNAVAAALMVLIYKLAQGLAASGGELTFLIGGLQTSVPPVQLWFVTGVFFVGMIVMLWLSGQLTIAGLSEAEAQSLGVRVNRLRWIGLVTASLMTASAVAISGPIGFVGLICPHLARLFVGSDARKVLPAATAMGASLLAAADAITRLLAHEHLSGQALPVGVLTGLLGGPFFLVILLQTRRRNDRGEGVL